MNDVAQQVLADEVGLYYLSGEVDFDDHDDLRARAEGSARTLVARHPSGVSRRAAALLREAAATPGHPLFRSLEETAQFGWDDDAKTLAAFVVLAHAIADRIDALVP